MILNTMKQLKNILNCVISFQSLDKITIYLLLLILIISIYNKYIYNNNN